jgi:hypothetical protein
MGGWYIKHGRKFWLDDEKENEVLDFTYRPGDGGSKRLWNVRHFLRDYTEDSQSSSWRKVRTTEIEYNITIDNKKIGCESVGWIQLHQDSIQWPSLLTL